MSFADAIKTCFRKYIVFSGRASRREFWWFVLAVFAVSAVASILDGVLFDTVHVETTETSEAITASNGPLASIWALATFLPVLAAAWRRMHDGGRPGWYLLLPIALQLAALATVFLGVAGFSMLEQAGSNPEALRAPAASIGLAGTLAFFVGQLVITILLIWWLARRSDSGANKYGPSPIHSDNAGDTA